MSYDIVIDYFDRTKFFEQVLFALNTKQLIRLRSFNLRWLSRNRPIHLIADASQSMKRLAGLKKHRSLGNVMKHG